MSFFGSHASIDCPHIRMYASIAYLMNFPNVMLITDIIMFALISPRHMVMALHRISQGRIRLTLLRLFFLRQ